VEASVAALLAVGLVSVISMVGALALTLPLMRHHRFLLILVAVAAGTLVGDAFFHLIPQAVHPWEERGLPLMGAWVIFGFVALFALEIILRSRHAHVEMVDEASHLQTPDAAHPGAGAIAPYAWTNLAADGLHNLLDGAVIATSFLADPALGIATTIAVVIHEVPQELGDFAVLLRAGLPIGRALAFNFGSALLAFLGAIVVLALPVDIGAIEAYGLPLIAGSFLYIAASDLIPELHHHTKGREAALILCCFVIGLVIMYGVLGLEQAGLLGGEEAGHDH
jgi:zinc and cadmium transporter